MTEVRNTQPTIGRAGVTPLALIVDDEASIRETLRDALSEIGLDVVAVGAVRDAIQQLSRLHYDVAVVDICLPDGSGGDVIRHALACRPPVPCVAISGIADTHTMHHCLEMGASACLWKPFRLEALENIVRRLLRSSGR